MEPGIVEYEDEEGDEVEPPAVRIGLLLDFDARSLTVYKNGVRLGNMVDGHWGENGPMEGQYSWALSTRRQGAHFERMELCSRPLASGNSRLRLLLSTVTKMRRVIRRLRQDQSEGSDVHRQLRWVRYSL
jgi:hypothetical protein